jgi:DNA-binding MarR family transcriptional regulator
MMTHAPYDDRLIFLIGQARQRLYTKLDQALLNQAGVTAAQTGALFFLTRRDGCLLMELSRGLMLDKSAVTRLAERLEKKELILRRPCPHDGRAVRVHLTPAGRWAAKVCLTTVKTYNETVKEGFSEAEIESFSRILQSVIRKFTEE